LRSSSVFTALERSIVGASSDWPDFSSEEKTVSDAFL
jgi:hypothetical protein